MRPPRLLPSVGVKLTAWTGIAGWVAFIVVAFDVEVIIASPHSFSYRRPSLTQPISCTVLIEQCD